MSDSNYPADGSPIVLTADRILFGGYRTLIEGMICASQTSLTPRPIMTNVLGARQKRTPTGATQAPLGLRRVESALVNAGIDRREIALAGPGSLRRAIGSRTKVIGISSGDPLGIGMNSTTISGIFGGEIYVSRWFKAAMRKIQALRKRCPEASVIMGGAGAWQLANNPKARAQFGIDHVITGYCEGNIASVISEAMQGKKLEPVIAGEKLPAEKIPAILGPTLMGGIEISRGCGLGCQFCTLARVKMEHLPVDSICADAETNLAAGVRDIMLVTEDAFRYGANGLNVNPGALISLLRELRKLPALRMIQMDHANVLSVGGFSDDELRETRRLFSTQQGNPKFIWLNLGVETPIGQLLAENGGRAKMGNVPLSEWGDYCQEQLMRLMRLGYFPLVSLIVGLPGEIREDARITLEWIRRFKNSRLAIVPLLYAPLTGEPAFSSKMMTADHWKLFRECYEMNFYWLPRLLADNQSAAGVPIHRRCVFRALGAGQAVWWKSYLTYKWLTTEW